MPVLDHKGGAGAAWAEVADDAALNAGDAAIVSPARLTAEGEALLAKGVKLGVILPSDVDLETVAKIAPRLSLIGVRFATPRDGRTFSVGRLLRVRYGFKGDLRTFGKFIPDQARFLERCGFTSFDLAEDFDIEAVRGILGRFHFAYQRVSPDQENILALRHGGGDVSTETRVGELSARYAGADTKTLLKAAIKSEFPGAIALSSSFGSESAVLLHMVAEIDPATPILFLDTGKLFGETQSYRRDIIKHLGLTNVISVAPDLGAVAARDPDGVLWNSSTDACCALRKVEPFAKAIEPFKAWITGRKAFQGGDRAALQAFEADGARVKINPLAAWSEQDIAAYFKAHNLPAHPLVEDGYRSIGCMPCTSRVAADENARAGRWRGTDKTECGIHNAPQRRVAS